MSALDALPLFISKYSFVIALLLIVGFLVYIFYLKPKMESDKKEGGAANTSEVSQSSSPPSSPNPNEKDTTVSRITRGFEVMQKKLAASPFIQNIKAQQEAEKQSGDNSFMPNLNSTNDYEYSTDFSQPQKADAKSKIKTEQNDFFDTDFSNLGKTDL